MRGIYFLWSLPRKKLIIRLLICCIFCLIFTRQSVFAESSSLTVQNFSGINITSRSSGSFDVNAKTITANVTAKTSGGWSLYLSTETEDNFLRDEKTGTKIKPISNSNSSYLSSNDYVSWGICTNTNKNNYCDGYDHSPIKGPSAPYLVRKSSEDANNLEVNSNIFIISSPQILSGNYKTKLVYTLINTSAPELASGREINKAIRQAMEETDPNIIEHPETDFPSNKRLNNLKFANEEPANAIKTVKISTSDSEEPAFLSSTKSGNNYTITFWSRATKMYANSDMSYFLSGFTNCDSDLFYYWDNNSISFEKVKNFSHALYRLYHNDNKNFLGLSSEFYYNLRQSDPLVLDALIADSNVRANFTFNTTKPVSTREMYKNVDVGDSFRIYGNYLINSSDMTSMFEGVIARCYYGCGNGYTSRPSSDFGRFTTSTNSMYKNSELPSMNFSDATFSSLTDTGSMFEGYKPMVKNPILMPERDNISKLTNMKYMFKNTSVDNSSYSLDLSSFNTENITDMSYLFGSDNINTNYQRKIIFGTHFTTKNVTNMQGMFKNLTLGSEQLFFDSQFNTSMVTNMSEMFMGLINKSPLTLSTFNTEKVTDMSSMFANSTTTSIDITGFKTNHLSNSSEMFRNNKNLTTIFASTDFKNDGINNSADMFTDSTKLQGGSGTAYDANHLDKEYARIDDATNGHPGYFTIKNT